MSVTEITNYSPEKILINKIKENKPIIYRLTLLIAVIRGSCGVFAH